MLVPIIIGLPYPPYYGGGITKNPPVWGVKNASGGVTPPGDSSPKWVGVRTEWGGVQEESKFSNFKWLLPGMGRSAGGSLWRLLPGIRGSHDHGFLSSISWEIVSRSKITPKSYSKYKVYTLYFQGFENNQMFKMKKILTTNPLCFEENGNGAGFLGILDLERRTQCSQ